jgi:hypothetical protein
MADVVNSDEMEPGSSGLVKETDTHNQLHRDELSQDELPDLSPFTLLLLEIQHRIIRSRTLHVYPWRGKTFFEERSFSGLVLHQSCLMKFNEYVRGTRRGEMVRTIWLRVELDEYDRASSVETETEIEVLVNGHVVRLAVELLFELLRTWTLGGKGIRLILSFHSPSDSQHGLPRKHQWTPVRRIKTPTHMALTDPVSVEGISG